MGFSFVNYEGPKLPQDPNVRKLIRRQAMRDAAEDRRSRGGYGQSNLRQYPVFLENDAEGGLPDNQHQSSLANVPADRRGTRNAKRGTTLHAASSLPVPVSIAYPDGTTTEKFALLLNLTPLTGLRLGIANFSSPRSDLIRSKDPISISNPGGPKLAHFITSRYGDVPALQYATDCVTAKLQQILRSPDSPSIDGENTILLHYTKALRALQAALEDETQRMAAETLCATELLAVFEVLDGNMQSHSWMHHAGGAAQLIQVRGAHRFNTESDMALFMAHIGPTVMDAFLSNKPCFLAEDVWKQLMRSVIRSDGSFIQLQDLALAIWCHLVTGPEKFKEVTDIISSPMPPPQGVIDRIVQYLLEDRESLLGWMERAQMLPDMRDGDFEVDEYGIMLPRVTFEKGSSNPDQVTQLTLWGTNIMCRLLKSRLLVAMAPARFRSIEMECQHLASKIMTLGQMVTENKDKGLLQTFFISQSTWIAKGVVETRDIWSEGIDNGEGMVEKWKFEAWCKAIGRKFPSM
ncbi:hypothetical protein B0T10DRAFT_95609 [Thelonectria olida]|uniref:Uncharacterized protein n=1 Tax=Thelonectria olida TaxID=1576542 RepID=A0A9P9AQ34_9HYPO|nr:hypothetical protein B0T10DRAFT_95609 [Thelonectria olida]